QLEVTAVDNSGCSTTKDRIFYPELPIDVTFSQRPYDTLFGYQERCPTNSIAVFGDPNNYDYTFNGNAVSSGSYIHTIPDSLDQDTVFVSWLSPNGCYTGNDTVLVEPFYPNFIEADTLRLCGGAGIIVGQNTFLGDNYLWNTGDDTPFLAIEVEDTVTYSVTITRGCVFEDEVVVIEVPSLEVDLGPDQLVCSGDSISLSANVTNGFPPIDYYWEKNDVDIDNNAPVLVTAPDVGLNLYSVAIQDSFGCVDVDFVEVLLDSIPTPIQINQTSACEGDFIMLSLSQNYETYNWNTGQIGPEIMVNQPGLYCVTVVNASGCTAEACIEPIFNLEPTVPDIFCNASLTTINFNWATDPNNFYDVNVLTGQSGQLNNGNFVVDGLVFGEEVTIELVVTSPAGCVSSNTLSCITEDCPEIEVAIDPVAAICLEGASPFALEATVMGVSGAGTATWSGSGIVDAAAGIFDPLAVGAGVHPVVFTYEEGGCIGTASINILVDAPLAIPQLNCTATTSALSFNWPVDPAVENYTVNVLSGQTGSTNGNLITFNDLTPEEEVCIELIADPGNSCDEVMATLCCTTNACPDDVVIDVESLVEVCLDDSPFMIPVNISGGMGGGTISWSGPCIDPVSFLIDPQVCGSGAIPLTVTYSEGPCIYEENVVVNIYENWNSDFEIAASEACVDDIVLITYTGNADPGATYGWIFDGGTVISGSGAGPYEVIWSEAGTQTVILTVEGNGCAGITNTQSIEIFEPTEPLNVNCVSTTSSIEFFWEIPVGVDSVSVNYLSGPTGILGDSTLFIDNLNPETAVDVEFISYSNTACGDTSVIMSCMTLPCPDIMLTLINPSGIICLDENPAPFELMYDIVGSNGTGNINWSGPGIISATDGLFDPQQAGVDTHEIILTYTEDNCTYIQSTDIEVTEGYTFENLNLNCSDDGNTYSLSLDIQTTNGTINYESDVVASGEQLVVEVPNGPGCDTPFVFSTIKDCNCLTYAGTLDFAVANQCGFPFVSVQHNGDDFLVEDDLLRFVLHTNNGNVLGEILAISEEPVFEYDLAWSTDEVYYISAVAGEEAAFQELNLNDPCLSVSAPQAIVFQEAIDLAVTPDTLICSGQSVALQATYNTVDSIAWTPETGLSCTDCPDPLATPVQTTTYTLTAYNEAGCTEIAQLTIYVDEFPESQLPSAPAPVCAGEYVEICLPEGGNYTWTGPSNYFSVDDCLIWPDFDPIYAGDYIIEVDLGNGCTFTDTLTLNAIPEQAINFLTADLEACPNEVFELQADIENAISYIWFPTENVQTNDSSATLASITTPTVFTLLTQDIFGCDGEFNVVVTNPTDCEIDGQIPLDDFASGNTPQQFFNAPASNGSNIRVYPNPSRNLVYVRSGATALQQLVVYDLSGKLMLNIESGNHEAQIDVQQWPAGTYLLSIFHENGVQHEKIVVLE
ncbi:MAG: T9SS type A sorting domain-containing protein, partial [Saprospiraceae bacterium]|nr:T9SS type A sorting domain-containing protein [Saprospiraceae bacterium]